MEYDSNNFIALFSSIKKKIYKVLNNEVKKYNISFIEAFYLILINEKSNLSFKELTKLADCDKGMTTKVINSLEVKGYVCSNVFNNKKLISITSSGKELGIKLKSVFDSFRDRILERVNKKELIDFYDSLYNFNKLLEGEIEC